MAKKRTSKKKTPGKKKTAKKTTKKKPAAKRSSATEKKVAISQSKPEKITSRLDPHLQEIILKSRAGEDVSRTFAQASADGTLFVDVIAKLKDPSVEVDGLKVRRTIGKIVTGQVAIENIEAVRLDGNVTSLKRATRLHSNLQFSVSEISAAENQLEAEFPGADFEIDGEGVIVGVIDYGCDFRHDNFRNADGTTRILSLWDQSGGENQLSPTGFDYGREFDSDAINAALDQPDPYSALAYSPGSRAHGTHVLDIAAGNGRATGRPGVAPGADIVFVNISHDDIELLDDPDSAENFNFGNSRMLLEAVDYIFTRAAELGRSAVINISLGTHGGPHDGSTLAEQGMDELLLTPGRAITISAGNSFSDRSHASGDVTKDAPRTLTWEISAEDDTPNELEVWYGSGQELAVALTTPSGQQLSPVALGTTVTLKSGSDTVGRIMHREGDPNNGDNHIDIILDPEVPAGDWEIQLSTDSDVGIHFDAWVERDFPTPLKPKRQSRLSAADDDGTSTIGSISCGELTIAVGSYLSGVPDRELSPFSAAGPTRDGKQKPEVSAPGQFLHPYWEFGILAAKSLSQSSVRMSGTSMASPHVCGLIALVMQCADDVLTVDEIRTAVVDAARRNPPSGIGWHARYGFGRVDALGAIESVAPNLSVGTNLAPVGAMPNGSPASVTMGGIGDLLATTVAALKTSNAKLRIQLEVEPAD